MNVIRQHGVAIAIAVVVGYWLGKNGGVKAATAKVKSAAS